MKAAFCFLLLGSVCWGQALENLEPAPRKPTTKNRVSKERISKKPVSRKALLKKQRIEEEELDRRIDQKYHGKLVVTKVRAVTKQWTPNQLWYSGNRYVGPTSGMVAYDLWIRIENPTDEPQFAILWVVATDALDGKYTDQITSIRVREKQTVNAKLSGFCNLNQWLRIQKWDVFDVTSPRKKIWIGPK